MIADPFDGQPFLCVNARKSTPPYFLVRKADAKSLLLNANEPWYFEHYDSFDGEFRDWCSAHEIGFSTENVLWNEKRYIRCDGTCDQARVVEMQLRWGHHS